MNEHDSQRNILILNIYTVFLNLVFVLPVILPFYRDELGLTFHEFLMAESFFALMVIVCDVPGGYLADRWGRKKALITGAAIIAMAYTTLACATGFWTAALAQGLIGVGLCCVSGANSALLYDTLLSQGREHEYRKREGFRFALQLYSCSIACIIGGYLYLIDHHLPLFIEVMLQTCAVATAFFLKEPERHKPIEAKHPLRDMRDTIIYALHGHQEIARIILLMVLVFASTKICMWSIQAYTTELHLPESYNGWILSSVMMLGAVSGHIGHRFLPKWEGIRLMWLMLGILTVAIIVAGLTMNYIGVMALGIEGFVYGFAMPRVQEYINQKVDSERRATILSTGNLSIALGFIPLSQMLGAIDSRYGLSVSLLSYAVLLIILGGCVMLLFHAQRGRYKATE